MRSKGSVGELLRACEAAREEGADFPTVWDSILRRHPMVIGPPVQRIKGGEAMLEIPLITGQRLVHGAHGYAVA